VFKKIDADGNEKIDLNELKNAMVAYQNGHWSKFLNSSQYNYNNQSKSLKR
jgi:Ca2+-binding EF-hand superfamily protein